MTILKLIKCLKIWNRTNVNKDIINNSEVGRLIANIDRFYFE